MEISVVQDALLRAVSGKELLGHPFYRRWVGGNMEVSELRSYAEQYRYFEAALPDLLGSLIAGAQNDRSKKLIERNLEDELGTSGRPSHLAIFDEFARSVCADPAAPSSDATESLLESHRDLVAEGTTAGLAGLLAYEMQLPALASTKAQGLRERFSMGDKAVEFWDVHASIDEDHATWGLEALVELDASAEVVLDAASRAADAWWSFLDEREAEHQPA
jgi:pyrroloquinoline quinone (PQQ) biosynthesis protein C